ncbi:MAG: hypothetical protein IJ303_02120, partial [Clostridia bacterium]|nr:hypothetical protein [Clostridia bacterium]
MKKNSGNDIMFELENERQINGKVYRKKNGQKMMIISKEPIHYLNRETGKYEEIEGNMKNTSGGYVAKFGDWRVSLPNGKGNDRTVRLGKDNCHIEWKYVGMNEGDFDQEDSNLGKRFPVPCIDYKKSISFPDNKRNENSGLHIGEHAIVQYEAVEDGISFEYETRSDRLKENIYVKRQRDKYSFCYDLKVKEVEPRLSESGKEIVFYERKEGKTGEKSVFRIPAPFMKDAGGARSDAVSYSLTPLKNKHYRFEIRADENWINAPERVLPVTIDPVIDFHEEWSESFGESLWVYVSGDYTAGRDEYGEWTFEVEVGLPGPIGFANIVEAYIGPYDIYADNPDFDIGQSYSVNSGSCCIRAYPLGDETTYGYAEFPGEFTCFCITYADSIAYLDNQTYLPVADSGEINLNSGEFTYFMEDMTVGGALMPIPVFHYFNADNKESKYGKLWNHSLNQHLEWVGNPTLKAVYTD